MPVMIPMTPEQAMESVGCDEYQIAPINGRWQVVGYRVLDRLGNEIARYDMKGRQVVSPTNVQGAG